MAGRTFTTGISARRALPGIILYAFLFGGAAILTVTSEYRVVLDLLRSSGFPEQVEAGMAGALLLVLNEIAYILASPIRSLLLYEWLPYGMAVLWGASILSLLFHASWGHRLTVFSLIAGFMAALAAGGLELKHGFTDQWRGEAIIGFLACHLAWLTYFLIRRRSAGPARSSYPLADSAGDERSLPESTNLR